MIACPDCGSEHMGQPCGTSFAQRIRSVLPTNPNVSKKDLFQDPQFVQMHGADAEMKRRKADGDRVYSDGSVWKYVNDKELRKVAD